MEKKLLIVLVTAPSREVASKISQELVKKHLVACVNIIPNIRSIFSWEGEIEFTSEALLLIKTRAELYDTLEQKIIELHPYDTPEILALSPAAVSKKYAQWIIKETDKAL